MKIRKAVAGLIVGGVTILSLFAPATESVAEDLKPNPIDNDDTVKSMTVGEASIVRSVASSRAASIESFDRTGVSIKSVEPKTEGRVLYQDFLLKWTEDSF